MTTATRGSRPLKEALFVQVKTPDESLVFFDETNKLGRKMPYDRPEATCAMRATAGVVAFSLLKLTNKSRALAVEQRLELPRGPLDRTERRAEALSKDLPENTVVVELDDVVHKLTISRDENKVVTLETPEGVDDEMFDLPKDRVRLTMVLRSPRGSKVVAAAFQGHVGKPGTKETLVRVAAIALNHLAGLATFRLVAGIETVNVPPSPARYLAVRPARKASDQAQIQVPVRLWTADAEPKPVAALPVDIRIDLDVANPLSGRLLFHLAVPAEHAETFKPYETIAAEAALHFVTAHLGPDEVSDLVFSIAVGELGEGDLGRLREALTTVTGLDLTPRQFMLFAPAA